MRALLLAAGLGIRLQPLTKYIPKCLVPINGRPLIDYWLENLLSNGVEEILINTHYMAPMVEQYLNQSTWSSNIKMVHEEILLGTGGTMLKNRDFLKNGTFLVAHADNLTIFDVQEFINQHSARPKEAEFTMMVFDTPYPESCGIVSVDDQGLVKTFHEKVKNPPGNLANGAVFIFEPSILDWIDNLGKKNIDISNDVIPYFTGNIYTYYNILYHRDIGSMESWKESNHDFPSMPASTMNERAWMNILHQRDGRLQEVINELLSDTKLIED